MADRFCQDGMCVPFGNGNPETDPACTSQEEIAAVPLREPAERCSWKKDAVVSTPMVADLDGDGQPEIVFPTSGISGGGIGRLVAIRGDNCEEVFNKDAGLADRSHLAIADLTGDGVPEIVGIEGDSGRTVSEQFVVVFDNTGERIARSPVPAVVTRANDSAPFPDGGVAIVNLDGEGPPELAYAGLALRFDGTKLEVVSNNAVVGSHWSLITAAADVDLDGQVELVTGNRIFDGMTGADETPANVAQLGAGFVAIAQWDKSTPEPEVIFVSSEQRRGATFQVYHPKTGNIVFGPISFGTQWGGAPTVADFDGDGEPEAGASTFESYTVFDADCLATPLPAGCQARGVRWKKTTQDESSGATGSSVFDFNGDGKAEVVYRDECWLRVFDGTTGSVQFAQPVTSGTILENPVIADTNRDGHADLVVPSGGITDIGQCQNSIPEADLNIAHPGVTQGVFVFQDPENQWRPARAVWNQHTYHITNVNDDLSIPATEENNWETFNNYRQNVSPTTTGGAPAPDLTSGPSDSDPDCSEGVTLGARICNRGTLEIAAGVPGTFYLGDPAQGGTAACSTSTTTVLAPGACEAVNCALTDPPDDLPELWFAADDSGAGGTVDECKEANNQARLPPPDCGRGELQ